MHIVRAFIIVLPVLFTSSCKAYDPLYCDRDRPCSDPERSFCDEHGEYPASEGIGRTCIPDPASDAGSSDSDDGGDQGGDAMRAPDGGPGRFVTDLALGRRRTCVILNDGAIRCWGRGPLGYPADVGIVGDDEYPFEAGDVPTGGPIKQIAMGTSFTCLLYQAGNVRCFGDNAYGQLGLGNTEDVNAVPADIDDVSLGEPATELIAGPGYACALLESGGVRCWGFLAFGALGYGFGLLNEEYVGDDELPSDLPTIDVGGGVVQLTGGTLHICAILGGGDGRIRCWGAETGGLAAVRGFLGYPGTEMLGDDEAPSTAGDVIVGGVVTSVRAYSGSTCALFEDKSLKCWGTGAAALGYANGRTYGDDETPSVAPDIMLGGLVEQIGGMGSTRCAIMSNGDVRCWGLNERGELGLGNIETVGDDELPVSVDALSLGGRAVKLASGAIPTLPLGGTNDAHMCALLESGDVRCWGLNDFGQLGLGHQENVGDNEVPSDEPPVRVLE